MRILIANDQHWPMKSGVATAARTLAQGLASLGHTVMVLAPSQNGKSGQECDENYEITRIRSLPLPFRKNLRVSVTYDREVRRILVDFNPDIVHVHTQLTVGLSALRAAVQLEIPAVATNHIMPDNMINNIRALTPVKRPATYLMNEYGVLLYRGARRIIVPTESVLDIANFGRLEVPFLAISNGIDLSLYSQRKPKKYIYETYDIPDDKIIVTWLGRLDREKHLDILVKAFAKLAVDNTNIHLLIVGSGNMESELIDLVEDLDIAAQVTFTGLVPEEDKFELHRVTSVFAVPSPNELQCLAMLEAMACGKPAVAVDAGALAELVHHDKNGYLVSVDDADGFARMLAMIIDSPERLESFGKKSRRIAEKHDIKRVMPRFVKLYEEVIEESQVTLLPPVEAFHNELNDQLQEL